MSKGILLHKTLGVNPRMTFCRLCGGETQELILLGTKNFVDTCESCGMKHYGGSDKHECMKCASTRLTRKELDNLEKVPSMEPCDSCKESRAKQNRELDRLYEEHKQAFQEGAVFAQCEKCNTLMIISGEAELAKVTRNNLNLPAPKACGVTVPECPKCAQAK